MTLSCVHLESGEPLPSVEEMYRKISLILVNIHKSTSRPRPQMPGIIQVGGAHIKPPNALPQNLQDFMDQAEHGVILFSLGAYLQSSQMPKEKIEIFLNAFSKLKQRIIWKFEDESIKTPPNVLVKKWLPQSDILAHKNVVLFITHGGKLNPQDLSSTKVTLSTNKWYVYLPLGMSGTFEGMKSMQIQHVDYFTI